MTGSDRDLPPIDAEITLLVAGDTALSATARANLAALLRDRPAALGTVRVIDVFAEPDVALRYGALFTPTLIVETAKRLTRIVGDLRDPEQVRVLLATPTL